MVVVVAVPTGTVVAMTSMSTRDAPPPGRVKFPAPSVALAADEIAFATASFAAHLPANDAT